MDIFFALFSSLREDCGKRLSGHINSSLNGESTYLVNSGTSACSLILKALKALSAKKEVVIPAYCASSLVWAIKSEGLKPVLCDISLDDFNLDASKLPEVVSGRTLAIIGVHMFGIMNEDLVKIRDTYPDIFIIEDCAQAFGSRLGSHIAGTLGQVSFFSFNRGKNLSTYGGGCVVINDKNLIEPVRKEFEKLKSPGLFFRFSIFLKTVVLYLASKPLLYGLFYFIIKPFKERQAEPDFKVYAFNNFQAALALRILGKLNGFLGKRTKNGFILSKELGKREEVMPVRIKDNAQPAFNRFPLLIRDAERILEIEAKLRKVGIESSRMYLRPLHQLFDLGYREDKFPSANYLARHLLTLPVHHLVRIKDLVSMKKAILENEPVA
jgi:dTDP-4-amino-4,6-dideoxygalactose transaminase